MFGRSGNSVETKPAERAVVPAPASGGDARLTPRAEPDGLSVIGRELSISGRDLKIVTRGGVRVDGEIIGDLYGSDVVIGPSGRVHGTVVGERVSIDGWVVGTVRGLRIELLPKAHVEGEIFHQTIRMEEGAFIEGALKRVAEDDIRSAMMAGAGTEEGA
jgi:cytoskeletal protein CcmA (bactofilin family)